MTQSLPAIPKAIRLVVGVASGAALLSALAAIPAAVALPPKPGYAAIAFESVAAVAGLMGLLTAFGRFRSGPALALACVAGSIFACSVLGYVGQQGRLGSVSLKPLLFARVGIAGLIGASAGLVVLARDRRSVRVLARAVVFAIPGGIIAAAVLWPRSREALMRLADANAYLAALGALLAFVIALVSASAALHLAIAAFSLGRSPPDRAP